MESKCTIHIYIHIYIYIYISIYFSLAVLGLHGCLGCSPVAASKGYSLVAMHELLIAVVFLVMKHWLQAAGFSSWSTWPLTSAVVASRILSTGLIVVAHGLSCSAACEIFPDQGLNPCLLHWQAYALPLSHQGSPSIVSSYLKCYANELGNHSVQFSSFQQLRCVRLFATP